MVKWADRTDSILIAESKSHPKIDSLLRKMNQENVDTLKIAKLLVIAKKLDATPSNIICSDIQNRSLAINYSEGYYQASLAKEFNFANTSQFDSAKRYHEFISTWALKNSRKDAVIQDMLNYAVAFEMRKKLKASDSLLLKAIDLTNELKVKNKGQMALAYYFLGKNKNVEFDNISALKYLNEAAKHSVDANNDELAGDVYFRIGECYLMESDFNNSLVAYGNSLVYCKKVNDQRTMASVLSAIGEIYMNKGDLKKAFENLNTSLEMAKKTNYPYQEAYTLSTLGSAYQADSNYTKAIECFQESNKIYRSFNVDHHSSEIILNDLNIGTVYISRKEYTKAKTELERIYKLTDVEIDPAIAAETMNNLSEVYFYTGNYNRSRELSEKSLIITKQNELQLAMEHSYELLYKIHEKKRDFEKAHFFYKALTKLSDSLSNKTQIKKFAELENDIKQNQLKAEHDIRETRLENEKLQKEKEIKQHQTTSLVIAIGFLVLLIFSVIIYISLQNNKKNTKIISEQKREVEQQNEIIEQKKKEVLDSIEYAKKIQEAILPSHENIKKIFPRSFVLYEPKDIVAGDFYWLEKTNDGILIAVGDCTGHGVPGAMVSVVCSNALNRAVKEFGICEPGLILDKVREIVVETFEKSGSEVQDGMDISLLSLSTKQDGDLINVKWAGANNPLWYVSENEFIEIKGNKQPVGKYVRKDPFTTQSLSFKKGDLVYLITDGFADQFGGDKGKKFKYKTLHELLLKNASLDVEEQKVILKNTFQTWKGSLEQVDDVCILGIKF